MTSDREQQPLVIICGPTAAGKTALGLSVAETFSGEIVSADSRQVYRDMDIGTAKPTRYEQERVPHHLIDLVFPDQAFNAADFARLAEAAIAEIVARRRTPLVVGGTGLYIRALAEGLLEAPGADHAYRARLRRQAREQGNAALHQELARVDPAAAERLHPNDLVRIIRALEVHHQTGRPLSAIQAEHGFRKETFRTLKIGVDPGREDLYRRIDARAEAMFTDGLIEEAAKLLDAGYPPDLKAMRTIGYRQAIAVLAGSLTPEAALDELKRATRRYAKQQLTWFRQDKSIIWVDSSTDFATIQKLIENFYGCKKRSGYG